MMRVRWLLWAACGVWWLGAGHVCQHMRQLCGGKRWQRLQLGRAGDSVQGVILLVPLCSQVVAAASVEAAVRGLWIELGWLASGVHLVGTQ